MIPLRWKEEISATISLNGCIFSRSKKSKKKMESLKGQSLQSVQFRFRTAEKEGVLLDGRHRGLGQEQDFLLALHDSKLHFKGQPFSISNFLDDNRFHSVQLFFYSEDNLTLILDGMHSSWKINGSAAIDFDKVVVGSGRENGSSLTDGYFKGCMRDLLLNEKHFVELPTEVERACQEPNTALLSFTTVRTQWLNITQKSLNNYNIASETSFL